MDASDFTAFVDLARERFDWTKSDLAKKLGCGRNQIAAWCRTGCPRYIGLACSALIAGWQPWRPTP